MSLLLLFFCLDDSFSIDELHIQRIGSSVAQGPVILFNGMSGLNVKIYWFNLEKQSGKTLDPNLVKLHNPYVLVSRNGFLLVQAVGEPTLVHLNLNGDYLRRQLLPEFRGWDDSLVFKGLSGYARPLMANFETRDGKKVLIAALDTEKQTLDFLHQQHQDEKTHRFYPWRDGHVHLVYETGLVEFLTSDFQVKEVLRSGVAPIPIDPSRAIARRRAFYSLLWPTAFMEDRIVFSFNKPDLYASAKYPEPLTRVLTLEKEGWQESTAILLGEHQGKKLLFDRLSQEFQILSARR